jgi:type III restriction enzyme
VIVQYDPSLVAEVGHTLDLRAPNLAALDAIAQALDEAEPGVEVIADLATGVGKTFIAAGLLDYLYESGVRNVVIITPGSTIQRKTIDNLTPGHRKYVRGLRCNPLVITLDDLENGTVASALDDDSIFKVYVFTVQSLLRPNTNDARRAHRPHETLGVVLYEHLQQADDLVVIADEHHVYYSRTARAFQRAIDDLAPSALIGLTATPNDDHDPRIVYRYPLADAIADGWVKIPVLVARRDRASDLHTQMTDGIALLDAKKSALDAYCRQTRKPPVNPVMFVVASNIDEANDIKDTLAGMLGGDDRVLLVTSEEPDASLALLDTLENDDSPIRAVVSVSMLKEGFDVKNLYVIAAVRALESQLLTEQVMGRGLRLPFGSRTGVPMLDSLEVLSHHAFETLLEQADVLLRQTLSERAGAATAVIDPVNGIGAEPQPVSVISNGHGSVLIELPGRAAAEVIDMSGWESDGEPVEGTDQSHVGMGFATLDSRITDAEATTATLNTVITPRTPALVPLPLFLPKVTLRWERDSFSLASVNAVDVEALGRVFANDEGERLRRVAIDASRDEAGQVRLDIRDEVDAVAASQALIPFESIEQDLARRLLNTNGVAQTVAEMNGAVAVAKAFLQGAGVTPETPWRAQHGQAATARLVEWIGQQRESRPGRYVSEVMQVRWPEPEERVEARPPQGRHLITNSRQFVRGYPYAGWRRGVYDITAFDAYSTEFRLAELFDTSDGVKAWVRIDNTVPLRIAYFNGAIQRQYEPDFIVIDDHDVHWVVEGKADIEVTSPVVLAKRDASRDWVATVNGASVVSQKWGYLLASESVIAAASSWSALKTAAQAFS